MRRNFIVILMCVATLKVDAGIGWNELTERPVYIHRAMKELTDVMVHDIYSPPVSSRTYAYISIAGYEAAIAGNHHFISFAGQLRGLKPLPSPDPAKQYSFTIAAVHAILTVGRTMVVSEDSVTTFYNSIMSELKASGIPGDVFDNSIAFGQSIARAVLDWASQDNYRETRTFSKYAVNSDASSWKPTPPAYMKAVEPHWNKIRTFVMDSAQQCRPLTATVFSTDKRSVFYACADAVYQAGLHLTDEQKAIASFWDCNPFKMNVNGHVMYASKKISPGGHWISITGQACRLKGLDVASSLEKYACLAVTMADAFISCWDEKYRSLLIRPETYINQYIDGAWMPLLQTPPFPEYPSGHSVVSTAAAVVLDKMFGSDFPFSDSTELEFGIPVRHFTSFKQAAEEAAISRFYGGIHYMPAIVNGSEEGRRIGELILLRLRMTSDKN